MNKRFLYYLFLRVNKRKFRYAILILKSFYNIISVSEQQKLSKWLNESADNQAFFDELQNAWMTERAPQILDQPIDVKAAFEEVKQMVYKNQAKKATRYVMIGHILRAAALVVLLLGGLLTVMLLKDSSKETNPLAQVRTSLGQPKIITLSDGTKVWLNGNSVLQYPASFEGNSSREVTLQGEAFFEVTKDPEHPFIVKGQKLQVKVLGTRFSFISDDSLNTHQVTVTEGKVQVSPADEQKETLSRIITPHQRITYTSKIPLKYSDNQGTMDVVWDRNILKLQKVPFDEVIQLLEKTYSVDITYPSSISNRIITLNLPSASIDDALLKLDSIVPFEVLMVGNRIELRFIKKTRILGL